VELTHPLGEKNRLCVVTDLASPESFAAFHDTVTVTRYGLFAGSSFVT
jgi:hypothetical protein